MMTILRGSTVRIGGYLRRNLVAILALVLALGTTGAYAADKIQADDIAKKAVRAKHIKKAQVKTKHLKNGAVTARKLAPGVVVNGAPGPQGPAGPPGPSTGAAGGDLTGSYPNPSLSQKPGASTYLTTSVPMATGGGVPFNSESLGWDVGNMHSTVANQDVFTAPRAGKYVVSLAVVWEGNAGGTFRRAWILKNKSDCASSLHHWGLDETPPNGTQQVHLAVDAVVQLGAGHTVRGCVAHNAGVPIDLIGTSNGTQVTRMAVQWVAP